MSLSRLKQKQILIEALADFLVDHQTAKSIESAYPNTTFAQYSKEWLKLRGASTLKGYPTKEEAIKVLVELLK